MRLVALFTKRWFVASAGIFLFDRTRAVVVVEAFMMLPPSVNRSQLLCSELGQPAVCIEASVCFIIKGRRISGHIGLLYNLTVDVQRKEGFPPRFYFTGNGTSNTTAGKIKVKHDQLTCVNHQAYMRPVLLFRALNRSQDCIHRDVRDIFTPIYFEAKYELAEHNVIKTGPVLQQREGQSNLVANKVGFTTSDLPHTFVLKTHKNMSYFALGNGKTIMLNVTLVNAGDDAFLPVLHLRYPNNLYFIKVLNAEERHVNCKPAEENKMPVGMDCSVGTLKARALCIRFSFRRKNTLY
ncbi:hypothetical protein JZ751_027911 [Albula glossodonta]|uniref:Integrin alpha-2 domain-containing protein n=1 Tax=Albula glossodonta TaxID=121402 RepID=A0A8T2PCJ3_9TELE|nr:hypothetical protein JZ751_027911 [Albula glossodonta]